MFCCIVLLAITLCRAGDLVFETKCSACKFQVKRVTMEPDPARVNAEVRMDVIGDLADVTVDGGLLETEVYYKIFGVWIKGATVSNNTCDVVRCPVPPSQVNIPFSMFIDTSTPTGSYSGVVKLYSTAAKSVLLSYIDIYWEIR